jgi:myo-inositol-1(or 4)-monophosphatase
MESFLAVAKEAAHAAGMIQKEKRGRVEDIQFKGDINLVTEVDRACETVIIDIIKKNYPNHQILAEESGITESGSPYKWIIDPLDGTTNFAHGYPCYSVSIALEHNGDVEVGVIYDPVLDEMFQAIKRQGATLNGTRIQVSQAETLNRSLLATGFAYDVQESENNNLDHFADFILSSQAVRRDGAAANDLAYVACGRYDGFWELNLWPWDVAAGALLVTEAGGQMSLFDGSPLDIYKKQIVASNGRIHDAMLETLKLREKGKI